MPKAVLFLCTCILITGCNFNEESSDKHDSDQTNQEYTGGDFSMSDIGVKVGEDASIKTPEPHLGGHSGAYTTTLYLTLSSGKSVVFSENQTGSFSVTGSPTPGFETYWIECKKVNPGDGRILSHKSNFFKVNWTN